MTYKEIMLAAWTAETRAILLAHPDGVPPTEDEMAKLYNGLRGAKHEASTSGISDLDNYNLRAFSTEQGIRVEFELKRKVRDRIIKQNPTEFM